MWLKHVLFELSVTAVIVLATMADLAWARWIVVGYTVLLLAMKVLALFGRSMLKSMKTASPDVPSWFWHANYAANVAFLAADEWWLPAVGWGLIWLLSVLFERGIRRT